MTAGAQPPAWRRRKIHRPAEIIDAAVKMVEEVGIDAISVFEVARRAGVSEATVYKYFKTKHDLIGQALVGALDPTLRSLEKDVRLQYGCAQRLRYFVIHVLRDMAERPNLHRTGTGPMRWSNEVRAPLRPVVTRYRLVLKWILKEGIKEGEVRQDTDTLVAGDMLVGSMASFAWRNLLNKSRGKVDIEAFALISVDHLLGGIGNSVLPQSLSEQLQSLAFAIKEVQERPTSSSKRTRIRNRTRT